MPSCPLARAGEKHKMFPKVMNIAVADLGEGPQEARPPPPFWWNICERLK